MPEQPDEAFLRELHHVLFEVRLKNEVDATN